MYFLNTTVERKDMDNFIIFFNQSSKKYVVASSTYDYTFRQVFITLKYFIIAICCRHTMWANKDFFCLKKKKEICCNAVETDEKLFFDVVI